jgi:hypothetical protein
LIAYAGLPLGCAVISRPLNLVMAFPMALYVLHKYRDQLLGFLLATTPSLLAFICYNTTYFGSPFRTGFGGTVISPTTLTGQYLSWFGTPLLEGLAGVLVSPARGLFVYSPIFLFSLAGTVMVWKEQNHELLKYLSLASIALIIPISTLSNWGGGPCYGPRLLADSTPILCVLLSPALEQVQRWRWLKHLAGGLIFLSIVMHTIGFATDQRMDADATNFDLHPERVWLWEKSPPVTFGNRLLTEIWQQISDPF